MISLAYHGCRNIKSFFAEMTYFTRGNLIFELKKHIKYDILIVHPLNDIKVKGHHEVTKIDGDIIQKLLFKGTYESMT